MDSSTVLVEECISKVILSVHFRITRLMLIKTILKKINFPNYEYFEDVNRAYSDFFQKLMTVIDNFAPCKTKQCQSEYSKLA